MTGTHSSDRTLRLAERALLGFALFLGTSAVFPVFDGSSAGLDPSAHDQLTEHLWFVVYAVLLVVSIPWYSRILELFLRVPVLPLLVGWALVSVTWSDSPALTLRRAVALILTTFLGLYLAVRLSRREFVDLFGGILAAVSILSLVVAVAVPRYGLDHLRGDTWRGVLSTKNGLGQIACLTLAVWVYRVRAYRTSRFAAGLVSIVAVTDIYFSESRTSIAVSLFLVLALAAAPLLQGDFRFATAASMFLLIAAGSMTFWLYDHSEKVLSAVGASENLTGRTVIWRAAWYMIHRHFWFGYGYNAFWTGIDGPSGTLWAIVGGTPPHAHNGFLDTWLDLGAVGVFFLACFLAWIGLRAWLSMRSGRADNMWSLVFLTFLLAFNFSESGFLSRNTIFWLMFVLAAAWVAPEHEASYTESHVPDVQLRRSRPTGAGAG